MLGRNHLLALAVALPLAGCTAVTAPVPREVLLAEDFNGENDGRYQLNYAAFAQWDVTDGTVDLVGTAPFDDFLPKTQGLYVDLDGSAKSAGTLRSRTRFDLTPGTYRLEFMMAGTPRPDQPPNTVIVSVGSAFRETITLQSYAPLKPYIRTFRVRSRESANLAFEHLGGDDYGNFIDDIRLVRL
jgi:hypothetical protein